MAARKPKNPFNDLADLVKSQMYGSRPTTTVSTQKKIKDVGTLVKTVDTFATGGLGRAVVADSKAQARGANVPVNLATYGVTSLAAGAVGAVVAKGAVRAVQSGRVVNPVAAARNLVTGKKVVIHGTPNKLEGKFVQPRAETYGAQDIGKPVVFNFDPRAVKAKSTIPRNVQTYSAQSVFTPGPSDYNAVIGRTPKSSINTHGPTGYKYSESPVSIDKVVKTNKPPEQFAAELQRELRKMGTQMRGTTIKQAIKDAQLRREIKNRPPRPRT